MIVLNNNNVAPTTGSKNYNDTYASTLREAVEFFKESNIEMVSGFSEIMSEDALFNVYKTRLNEGLDADTIEQLDQIMENSRFDMLRESSINQISPIAGLSMPTVRKMWLSTALKNAIPTEVAKVPTFSISYMEPYLIENDGTKHPLPEALRDFNNTLAEKVKLTQEWLPVTEDAVNLIDKSEYGIKGMDVIDPIFYVEAVKVLIDPTATPDESTGVYPAEALMEKKVNIKLSLDKGLYSQFKFEDKDGNIVSETIFGTVDCIEGDITLTSVKGTVKEMKIKGWFSSENNSKSTSVSFDIKQKKVNIGTGAHFNATLPIEWLQDTLALYNIDGTVEVVDLMSQTVSQKLDQEIRLFLEQSFDASGAPFQAYFDVKPSGAFAGLPTQWRAELKTVIEHWGTKLKQSTAYQHGYFVIVGNRIDVNLLPDINWTFRSIQSERGGVRVDYDLGAVTYNNVFQIVASDNMPQGTLRMFFVPTEKDKMSYKYYPYTFNVEKGYNDPKNPLVPSIMMTKRHTMEELVPCQCIIKILNNDGNMVTNQML